MNVIYQSPYYKPDIITDRYLHIDIRSGKPVVNETVKTPKTNYTYRSYELPEDMYTDYSNCIADAEKIKRQFPYEIELKKNLNIQVD